MTVRTFTAVLHKEDDIYVAECPEVGTVSQGSTVEEVVANLREATELYLEELSLPKNDFFLLKCRIEFDGMNRINQINRDAMNDGPYTNWVPFPARLKPLYGPLFIGSHLSRFIFLSDVSRV